MVPEQRARGLVPSRALASACPRYHFHVQGPAWVWDVNVAAIVRIIYIMLNLDHETRVDCICRLHEM